MTPGADDIIAFVRQYDHVSFAELMHRFELPRGTVTLELQFPHRGSVVLWAGMAESTAALFDRIIFRDKRLTPQPCSWMVYLADGAMLRLPIVKRAPPKGGYRQPHWLPVTLRLSGAIREPA